MCRILLIMAFALHATTALSQECRPHEFFLMESTDLNSNDIERLAFIETMNVSEFKREQAKGAQGIKIEGTPITGFNNMESAKAAGRRESMSRYYTHDSSQSLRLLQNKVSAISASGYVECLKSRRNEALSAYVSDVTGKIVVITAIFRPTDNSKNYKFGEFGLQNFVQVSRLPKEITPNEERKIVFRRLSDVEGTIEIVVGNKSVPIVFPEIIKIAPLETDTHISKEEAHAATDREERQGDACTEIKEGWVAIKNTAEIIIRRSNPHSTAGTITFSERKICWTVIARTATRRAEYISGKLFVKIQKKV